MFIAGGLLWVDLQPRQVNWFMGRLAERESYVQAMVTGWPSPHTAKLLNGEVLDVPPLWFSSLVNLFCFSLILLVSGICCEYLIAMKYGKK